MSLGIVILLGLIQGLTEFLPVSSSAHLILFPWFFGFEDPGLGFDVCLHLGTAAAIFIYFFKEWWELLGAGIASIVDRRLGFEPNRMLFWLIMVSTVPGALCGYLFHEAAESSLRSPLFIAVLLAGAGCILYYVDMAFPALKRLDQLTFKDALWVGIAQAFAVLPGVSRSGATICMARVLGIQRESAARFSFLMAFPIILAAGLFEGRKLLLEPWDLHQSFLGHYLLGFFVSAVVGMITIHLLLSYVKRADFKIFAWYRVGLALAVVLYSVILLKQASSPPIPIP